MGKMGVKPFLTYSFFGVLALICGFVIYASHVGFVSRTKTHPDYARYVDSVARYNSEKVQFAYLDAARDNWINAHQELATKRKFELAIAGKSDIDIHSDPKLWRMTFRLKHDGINDGIKDALIDSTNPYVRCEKYVLTHYRTNYVSKNMRSARAKASKAAYLPTDCKFIGAASVLNEPGRLAGIMKGDTSLITPPIENLAPIVPPTPYLEKPIYPSDQAIRYAEFTFANMTILGWPRLKLWCLASIVFAIGFVGLGLVWRGSKPHPLVSVPDFALGWLVLAAAAPGFAIMHGLRPLILPVGKVLDWFRGKLRPVKFDDEYVDIVRELVKLREQATMINGNAAVVTSIDERLRSIAVSRDAKRLAKIKESADYEGDKVDATEGCERIKNTPTVSDDAPTTRAR